MLTCGFNLLHAAPFLNNKDQFHRREKKNSKMQYSTNNHLNINHSKRFFRPDNRVLDKLNNIGAMHTLPAGTSTRRLGLQLGLLAYETGCAGKKMK